MDPDSRAKRVVVEQGHEDDPAAAVPPDEPSICQCAEPSQSAVTEPETAEPTWMSPLGRDQLTWQLPPVPVVVVVEVVLAEVPVEALDVVEVDAVVVVFSVVVVVVWTGEKTMPSVDPQLREPPDGLATYPSTVSTEKGRVPGLHTKETEPGADADPLMPAQVTLQTVPVGRPDSVNMASSTFPERAVVVVRSVLEVVVVVDAVLVVVEAVVVVVVVEVVVVVADFVVVATSVEVCTAEEVDDVVVVCPVELVE